MDVIIQGRRTIPSPNYEAVRNPYFLKNHIMALLEGK